MGLSTGGLIRGWGGGGAYIQLKNNGKWDDISDKHNNTEWTSLLEKTKKMYRIIHLFPHLKNLYLKSYLFGSKIGINALIRRRGLCAEGLIRGGAYTWSNTSVKEKVGLSAEGPVLIGGEIRYLKTSKSPHGKHYICRPWRANVITNCRSETLLFAYVQEDK